MHLYFINKYIPHTGNNLFFLIEGKYFFRTTEEHKNYLFFSEIYLEKYPLTHLHVWDRWSDGCSGLHCKGLQSDGYGGHTVVFTMHTTVAIALWTSRKTTSSPHLRVLQEPSETEEQYTNSFETNISKQYPIRAIYLFWHLCKVLYTIL